MPKTTSATGSAIAVSVVVPTCGRMDLLDRCLDALTRQTLPAGSYEVIVVDDEPNHNTLHLVAGWRARTLDRGPRLVYLPNSAEHGQHGPAAARNLGWRAAQAPIVAFTDDDGVPSPSWLAQGLAAFGEEVDVLCGLVDKPPLAGPFAAQPRPAQRQGQGGDSVAAPEVCVTNCFCRKHVLQALQGFDERFEQSCHGDADLHFRLLGMGARIVSALDAVVVQPVPPMPWGASLAHTRRAVFDALLYKKHPQLYCEKIGAIPPLEYYLATAALAVALGALLAGAGVMATVAGLAWLGLTARLCAQRLRGGSASPGARAGAHSPGTRSPNTVLHVLDMIVTSALIPPLAVFWRLVGAVRYRVRFT
ncbi:glycosyltransferase family 2 protein [Massilia niabensis]|uniref:Glycosyltransferase family 2 protein n=1 Tax=Massilia niabensis TaxID=544910 RepID=A0ABW0L7S8_9BURK